MAQSLGLGLQNFEIVREKDNFYVDKTDFIREWWESNDMVTLITRPRRFGKTLMMSTVENFFSIRYADRAELFQGTKIWTYEKYRQLQGTYPVLFLSFADIKSTDFAMIRKSLCLKICGLFDRYRFVAESDRLSRLEKDFFASVAGEIDEVTLSHSLQMLTEMLYHYYGRKVIILLDEYDAPMQEAYLNGFWEELLPLIRGLFNAAFKTNPYLERAILTGITRISRESVFSDLNNLRVISVSSDQYAASFGFTEEEVFSVLDEYGLSEQKEEVKRWYDGFRFGSVSGIYNPWSIIHYLSDRKIGLYWANTSSNHLINELLRRGSAGIKEKMQELLGGGTITVSLDEQIVFSQLNEKESAVWSLLLACGYLKLVNLTFRDGGMWDYELALTNLETRCLFQNMVHDWFSMEETNYNGFIRALLDGDLDAMNGYMNQISMSVFSFFDTGKSASTHSEPERFYHGFVLGLMVDLADQYVILSNRESGFGRYDIVLEPKDDSLDAFIIEFKVFDPRKERSLADTVGAALKQIDEKKYASDLATRGISGNRIRRYGFAFQGKTVLIGSS